MSEWRREDGFVISTDWARVDRDVVRRYLAEESYWAQGLPEDVLERAIAGSLNFGVYEEVTETQVGFARVVTDYATFAYLCDVFVLPEYRGRGLSKWLMEVILAHPELQGFRRWMLMTKDAHSLYARFGFTALPNPENAMQIHNPTVYQTEKPL